jgi:glycerol-3-phosphate cytidylyltransferase
MATVLTMGTFDLLHPGHVRLFAVCRQIAGLDGLVIVAVNTDEFIEQFKGHRPTQTYAERVEMIEAVRYVDDVVQTPGPDAKELIDQVHPDILVIGSDWATKDYYAQLQISAKYLQDNGIALLYLDRNSGHSSTELKERIRGT